jgi:hypothetical protein
MTWRYFEVHNTTHAVHRIEFLLLSNQRFKLLGLALFVLHSTHSTPPLFKNYMYHKTKQLNRQSPPGKLFLLGMQAKILHAPLTQTSLHPHTSVRLYPLPHSPWAMGMP